MLTSKWNLTSLLEENERRQIVMSEPYDPVSGIGSPIERVDFSYSCMGKRYASRVPSDMLRHPFINLICLKGSIEEVLKGYGLEVDSKNVVDLFSQIPRIRFQYDFEFWAFSCVKIQDKESKREIPFKLNRAQRRLLNKFEDMRKRNVPIRVILLKARQWGGSTLTQMYMAWIQNIHMEAWHLAVVTQVEDQAKNIRNMYAKMGKSYPSFAGKITFGNYAGSSKNKIIKERGCVLGVGSVEEPDSLRSFDFSMLHLSEVGLWKDTATKKAADLAQSLQSTVPDVPLSVVVMESTAKGVGNFFHKQWMNAERGKSVYEPVFIPWFDIERYQQEVTDIPSFVATWTEYHWFLWESGATIEGINWYFSTMDGYDYDHWRMKSEYPSSAAEAFQSTGRRAFAPSYVLNARATCAKPSMMGDLYANALYGPDSLKNIEFKETPKGRLWVWSLPDKSEQVTDRYCLFADIGGRNESADYSVIKVLDRYWLMDGGTPEVAAVWYGHLDQDIFAWKCAQLASFYNTGLLAIESNSLRKEKAEGDHFLTVLDKIAPHYSNLYTRSSPDDVRNKLPVKYGFHTNQSTKPMIIDALNAAIRDSLYVERDARACDEMDYYEVKPDGTYGAIDGQHDDHVMTTAGVYWINTKMPLPRRVEVVAQSYARNYKPISEASI